MCPVFFQFIKETRMHTPFCLSRSPMGKVGQIGRRNAPQSSVPRERHRPFLDVEDNWIEGNEVIKQDKPFGSKRSQVER